MTAPHAVLEEVPPARKAKAPGPGRGRRRIAGPMAPVEIRDLSKHFRPVTTVRAQDPVSLTRAFERRGHRVDRDGDVLNVSGGSPNRGDAAGSMDRCLGRHPNQTKRWRPRSW